MSGKSRGTCGKQGDHLGILSRRVSKRIRRKTASYEVTSAYTCHLSRSLVFQYPQLRNQHSNCIVLVKALNQQLLTSSVLFSLIFSLVRICCHTYGPCSMLYIIANFCSFGWKPNLNPVTPKILLVIVLTVCHTVLVMLVWRSWFWVNL